MSNDKEQLDQIIAALQFLRDHPVGAENEPDYLTHMLTAAIYGRSGTGHPHPATDRPAPVEFERLARENDLLTHQLGVLASALGACADCWGTIPDCECCGGSGRPGAIEPDRTAFNRYVLPALTHVMGERSH